MGLLGLLGLTLCACWACWACWMVVWHDELKLCGPAALVPSSLADWRTRHTQVQVTLEAQITLEAQERTQMSCLCGTGRDGTGERTVRGRPLPLLSELRRGHTRMHTLVWAAPIPAAAWARLACLVVVLLPMLPAYLSTSATWREGSPGSRSMHLGHSVSTLFPAVLHCRASS